MKGLKITARQRSVLRNVMRELGRRGGKASAKALTAEQRRAKARRAGKLGGRPRTKKGGRR